MVPKEAAAHIIKICSDFKPDWDKLRLAFFRDGVIVPELVGQLRAIVGEPNASFVHYGATSQDVIDTSLMLRLVSVLTILERQLDKLIANLAAQQEHAGATQLMAHTRMQEALPFTVSDKLKTWIDPLRRARQRLSDMRPRVLVIQFGGPIGVRGGLGTQGDALAEHIANKLGLGIAACWHAERDRIAEVGSWLSLVSGIIGKIGQDVALMAQNEIGSVAISGPGGSSSMPRKANPVAAEVLVSLARFNSGLLGTLFQALIHENERSGAAWTLEWLTLPRMVISAAASLRIALIS